MSKLRTAHPDYASHCDCGHPVSSELAAQGGSPHKPAVPPVDRTFILTLKILFFFVILPMAAYLIYWILRFINGFSHRTWTGI